MSINQYNPTIFTHPGEILQEKLEEIGMGVKEFALRSGKPENTIYKIIKGSSSITSDMAVKFESVLNIPAKYWLNFQAKYDESVSRMAIIESHQRNIEWAKNFPYSEMSEKGWIPFTRNATEKVEQLLKFFGFAEPKGWEDYYMEGDLKTAFRISLKVCKNPYSVSAWLRKGEVEADKIVSPKYDEQKFKKKFEAIRELIRTQPDDYFIKLQSICLSAGVKVIHIPNIKNAPIDGGTRWIKETPIIQVSGRYNQNDRFWFTFIHEVGHILLHGKKDILLEGLADFVSDKKEKEADKFAEDFLLNSKQEEEILANLPMNKEKIMDYAHKFKTNPGIIVGRLQFKLNKYNFGNEYFLKLKF